MNKNEQTHPWSYQKNSTKKAINPQGNAVSSPATSSPAPSAWRDNFESARVAGDYCSLAEERRLKGGG